MRQLGTLAVAVKGVVRLLDENEVAGSHSRGVRLVGKPGVVAKEASPPARRRRCGGADPSRAESYAPPGSDGSGMMPWIHVATGT